MKKLISVAVLGLAVGAATYLYLRNNQGQLERTLDALDKLEREAEDAVDALSQTFRTEGKEA